MTTGARRAKGRARAPGGPHLRDSKEALMSDKRTTIASSAVVPTAGAGGWSRRSVLKGAAAGAGLAAGSGALTGFPTIWAQNIKDVTLLQVGGSYSAIIDIARKASEDLGFKIEMQTADHAALLNRLVSQPESLDIADTEFFFLMYTVPRGIIQSVDLKKYKWWDQVVPIFTKGQYPDGREVSRQGINPYEVQYVEKPGDTSSPRARPATRPRSGPSTSDTLGLRPDLIKRPIEHWTSCSIRSSPEDRARRRAPDRIMDAAMALNPGATSSTATRAT